MKTIFGRKWNKKYDDETENVAKRLWASRFVKEDIKRHQIDYALEQLIQNRTQWPPELTEFLNLCDAAVCLELPERDSAKQEIINWHCRYRGIDEKPELSHRIVSLINDEIGEMCKTLTAQQFDTQFDKYWKKYRTLFLRNALPPARPALEDLKPPAPDPRVPQIFNASNHLFTGEHSAWDKLRSYINHSQENNHAN